MGNQLFSATTLRLRIAADAGLVQPSTDGVFLPERPERIVTEPPDAADDYGWSKQFAEWL